MMVDLIILNTRASSYLEALGDQVTATVLASSEAGMVDRPGGVFVRRRDLLGPAELRMLRATARVHLSCDGRRLGAILESLTDATEEVKEIRLPPRRPLQRTLAGLVERLRIPPPVASVGQAPRRAVPEDAVAAPEDAPAPAPCFWTTGSGVWTRRGDTGSACVAHPCPRRRGQTWSPVRKEGSSSRSGEPASPGRPAASSSG
jgi:cyclic beta-1,2-glucan synthetase